MRADRVLVVDVLAGRVVPAAVDAVAELRRRVHGGEYPLADAGLVTVAAD